MPPFYEMTPIEAYRDVVEADYTDRYNSGSNNQKDDAKQWKLAYLCCHQTSVAKSRRACGGNRNLLRACVIVIAATWMSTYIGRDDS